MTIILYLIGKPGVGKYTIAKEMAKYGYIICDNHLINNPIFALLSDIKEIPEAAWLHTRKIRQIVFDFMSINTTNNYILTNSLYKEDYDSKVYAQALKLAATRNSVFIPIRLLIDKEEHIKRITQKSRINKHKTIDPIHVYCPKELIEITHQNLLNLDVSNLSVAKAATIIKKHVDSILS